jgi:transposase
MNALSPTPAAATAPRILALDVSKDTLQATLLEASTGHMRELKSPNSLVGIQQLLAQTPPDCEWVLEPTGRYSILAVDTARAAGRTVRMAEPRRAAAYLRSLPTRAKCDRLDSRGLAQFAAAQTLPLYPRPRAEVERLQQLLAARRGISQSRARLKQQRRELPHAADALAKACTALTAELQALDAQIAQLVATPEQQETFSLVATLDEVPGIGPITAAAVGACLQSRQFSHPDQFVAFTGLDITVRQSGRQQSPGRVSQRGDAELRRLLYLAAQANLRVRQSPFRQQYDRERAKGLSSTAALCAVARKLAKVCWSLAKHGGPYDPERVLQPPSKKT